jgi:photosystem II stability/assembly factor-like uncharacterized protein
MMRHSRRLLLVATAAVTVAVGMLPAAAPAGAAPSVARATPPGGPVPAGFRVQDLTFVGTRDGWALGTAPCSHRPCTSVVRTRNAGKSWVGIPAPIAALTNCSHVCVSGLRFANPQVGYAFRSGLEMTTDGGQTWRRQPGNAIALGVVRDRVIRVSANHPRGCPPGCTFRLRSAAIGSTTWHNLPAPRVVGDFPDVEAAGSTVVVTIAQNPAGGAQDAHATLLLSHNGGVSWHKRGDPCRSRVAGEDDTVSVGVTTHQHVAVLCRPRRGNSGHDFVLLSHDGGRSFGRARAIGATGGRHAAYLVAVTRHAVFVATNPGTGHRARYDVDVSRNHGRTWTRTFRQTGPARLDQVGAFLGFESGSVGHFVGNAHTVTRTTDAGRRWRTYRFPS